MPSALSQEQNAFKASNACEAVWSAATNKGRGRPCVVPVFDKHRRIFSSRTLAVGAEQNNQKTPGEILRFAQDSAGAPASLTPPERPQKRNDPPVSLPRRFRVEPVDQFFSCQVLQLLTLEAASRKRLSLSLSLRSKPLKSKAFDQRHLCP